jgi:uncharacterized protein YegJ (DUF2314 family)
MRNRIASMTLAFLLALVGIVAASAQNRPGFTHVPSDDPEMIAAQAKARATLAEFWSKLERPGPGESDFALKVGLPVNATAQEHIWVANIQRGGGKIFGRISNEPVDLKTVKRGQRIEIVEDQISDWTYLRDGKIVGNFTVRPILNRLPPQEAERYRAMLAEP